MIRFLFAFFAAFFLLPAVSQAQNAVPELPEPLQNLANEGAQVRYLGREHGLDGWITIKRGQEQYFYVLPDRKAFVMGVLFGENGQMLTIDQVRRLRGQEAGLDALAADPSLSVRRPSEAASNTFSVDTPSERLFSDVQDSNWIPVGGGADAPVIYAFIDPQCPHCHAFLKDVRGAYIDSGRVQIRMVPVGLNPATMAQAAFLLATPDPEEKWFRHMDGDEEALPIKPDINQQGVQRNMAIMQSWRLDATPLLVYRDTSGTVKIVRGRPQDAVAVMRDLGAG